MIEVLKNRLSPLNTVDDLKALFFKDSSETQLWWESLVLDSYALLVSEKKMAEGQDIHYALLGDAHYPKLLMQISDPPLIISYQGPIEILNQKKCLSVVGAREPHELTKQWMRQELYQFLKTQDVVTISGGARGVDGLVHQLSLFLNKPTAVVLPSGLIFKYPDHWNQTRDHEQKNLIFLSEMRLSAKVAKQNFACRNRIIAALSPSLLIMEANVKSGTLITAHRALIENRQLLVLPAHPLQMGFAGSLELLALGGKVVRHKEDLESQF